MSTRSQLTKDLNESVKAILGRHTKILVKYMVKLETKGDKTENRVLVFTPVRTYLLIAKVPTKIDCHFHYLDIQSVESKNSNHFSIATNDRTYSFSTSGDSGNFSSSADVILTDLASAIKQVFPTVPLKYVIKRFDIQPEERESIFSDELWASNLRNVGPCGGFSTQYACMCDFHGVPFREEVQWDIDTIYMSHDTRVLNLRDFEHLEAKDLMAIVSALEYNTFFRGLKVAHMKLSHETLDRILYILKRSMWLEELHLESLGLKSDFLHKLAVSVITNNNPALRAINLNHNLIDDKGAINLAGPIAKVSKGLSKLSLSHCGLTAKGVSQIAHSLQLNQTISSSLTYLDLSGNNLKDDINNLYTFLAQPNLIDHLDLSSTDTTLENLFGALLRGCSTHLAHLNVSSNSFSTKKGKEIPPSFKQFFTSSLSLKYLNISSCKLPLEALKNLLLGLACNESTAGLHLDISCNSLGAQGAHVLESCIHGVRVLQSVDISENNLDSELSTVLTAIGKNPSIRTLYLQRSFTGIKLKHIPAIMDALVNLIQKDDFQLQELVLADNKLKNDLHDFINALGSNQTLLKLDISGNYMGDVGARLLAKALQINTKLRTIMFDKNNITMQGYNDIVYALEKNFSMRHIPFPLYDVAPSMKSHPERTDLIMRKMQEYLMRNGNDIKRSYGQGFRLQHGFLMASAHQLVDKLVADTQESMSLQQGNADAGLQRLLEDAENSKQLLTRLQEAVRVEHHPIELKMSKIASDLSVAVQKHLEEVLQTMIQNGMEQCPKTLGNPNVIAKLRKTCIERLTIPAEFYQTCILNNAGSEIMMKISEIEQHLASTISDRAIDEVIEALTRFRRGIENPDALSFILEDAITPDVIRSRPSHDTLGLLPLDKNCNLGLDLSRFGNDTSSQLEYLNLATPFTAKRVSTSRKIRPQSVVEMLSLGHIPDLLDNQNSQNGSNEFYKNDTEQYDSITELPSTSLQLQHLVKGRPKKAKTRAPTRTLLTENVNTQEIGEGLDTFFRTGSATPNTVTPLISPTSEDCSSLSYVDSSTISRDEFGKFNCPTSEETTPIMEERRAVKLERGSPVIRTKDSIWTPRSRSTDNIEKFSPRHDRKSPLKKMHTMDNEVDGKILNERLLTPSVLFNKSRTPSIESIRSESNGIRNSSMSHKLRPSSILDGDNGQDDESDSTSTDPKNGSMDEENVLPIVGQAPGGSIVGISPGTVLEKKSVRDLAARLNQPACSEKPQVKPRIKLNSDDGHSTPNRTDSIRQIAGKKITALFEEQLVEGLQRSSFRQKILRDEQYNRDDSVDV